MINLTQKQREALLALEETNGSLKNASLKLGIAPCSLKNRIEKIQNNTTLDPVHPADRRQLLRMIREQGEDSETAAKKKPFKKCDRPCKYRSSIPHVNGCDYLYLTGKRRDCEPGENCKRFERGERIKDPKHANEIPKLSWERERVVEGYAKEQRRRTLEYLSQRHK